MVTQYTKVNVYTAEYFQKMHRSSKKDVNYTAATKLLNL